MGSRRNEASSKLGRLQRGEQGCNRIAKVVEQILRKMTELQGCGLLRNCYTAWSWSPTLRVRVGSGFRHAESESARPL